jgi:hypothetical protein
MEPLPWVCHTVNYRHRLRQAGWLSLRFAADHVASSVENANSSVDVASSTQMRYAGFFATVFQLQALVAGHL